jgi:toxin HigB-1
MEVEFGDTDLDRLEVDPHFKSGFQQEIVKAYRKRMQTIRAATDTRVFYALKSLHFEKLSGDREGQSSMRLNKKYRLILEILDTDKGQRARILEINNHYE